MNGGSPGNPRRLPSVPLRQVVLRVERLDRDPRRRLEAVAALGRALAGLAQRRASHSARSDDLPYAHAVSVSGNTDSARSSVSSMMPHPGQNRTPASAGIGCRSGRQVRASVSPQKRAEPPVRAPRPARNARTVRRRRRPVTVRSGSAWNRRSAIATRAGPPRPRERPPGVPRAPTRSGSSRLPGEPASVTPGTVQRHERRPLAVAEQPEQQVLGARRSRGAAGQASARAIWSAARAPGPSPIGPLAIGPAQDALEPAAPARPVPRPSSLEGAGRQPPAFPQQCEQDVLGADLRRGAGRRASSSAIARTRRTRGVRRSRPSAPSPTPAIADSSRSSSARQRMYSASITARRFSSSRVVDQCESTTRVLPMKSSAMWNVPTDLPSTSLGPATPTIPMPASAPVRSRTAVAIASAVSPAMVPCASTISLGHARARPSGRPCTPRRRPRTTPRRPACP